MLHGARELPLHSTAPSIHVVQLGRVASHSLRRGKAFGRMAALVVNDQHDRLETDQLPHSQWTQEADDHNHTVQLQDQTSVSRLTVRLRGE